MNMSTITQDMIDCWRINYGLDKRSPEDAARWWGEHLDGKAPAGVVAALGLVLNELDALRKPCGTDNPTMSTTPETIQWHDAGSELPHIVLLVLCRSTDHSVCVCYCAGRTDDGLPIWRTITGWPILEVTHWAEMPKGPNEAKARP